MRDSSWKASYALVQHTKQNNGTNNMHKTCCCCIVSKLTLHYDRCMTLREGEKCIHFFVYIENLSISRAFAHRNVFLYTTRTSTLAGWLERPETLPFSTLFNMYMTTWRTVIYEKQAALQTGCCSSIPPPPPPGRFIRSLRFKEVSALLQSRRVKSPLTFSLGAAALKVIQIYWTWKRAWDSGVFILLTYYRSSQLIFGLSCLVAYMCKYSCSIAPTLTITVHHHHYLTITAHYQFYSQVFKWSCRNFKNGAIMTLM